MNQTLSSVVDLLTVEIERTGNDELRRALTIVLDVAVEEEDGSMNRPIFEVESPS